MKKALKAFTVIGTVILAPAVVLAVIFAIYRNSSINRYDSYENAPKTVNAQEKQVTPPNGSIINYGEAENDKPALLLIHSQMSTGFFISCSSVVRKNACKCRFFVI